MPVAQTPLFKLVSLRRPLDGLTTEPTEDDDVGVVERLLRDVEVDPVDPSPEVLRRIADVPVLSPDELESSLLAPVSDVLRGRQGWSLEELRAVEIGDGEQARRLPELAGSAEFRSAYRDVTDSWLALTLRTGDGQRALRRRHERLLQAAHLAAVLRSAPTQLRETGAADRLLTARVVLPRDWRRAVTRFDRLEETYSRWLAEAQPPEATVRDRLESLRQTYQELAGRIQAREALAIKAHRALAEWLPTQPATVSRSPGRQRLGGALRSIRSRLFGKQPRS